MKKIVFGLHITLILLSIFFLYSLWIRLTQVPSEVMQLDKYEIHAPLVNQTKLLENYPPLFDILMPPVETKKEGNQTEGSLEELITKNGKMRVRGVFTLAGDRMALVEIIGAGPPVLTEVREKDILQDYRVMAIGTKSIHLLQEESEEMIELIIFNRDKDHDSP